MTSAALHSHKVSPSLQFVDFVTAEATQSVAQAGMVGTARANFKSAKSSGEGPGVMMGGAAALDRYATGVARASASRPRMPRAEAVDTKRSSASEVGRFRIFAMMIGSGSGVSPAGRASFSYRSEHKRQARCKAAPDFSSGIPAVVIKLYRLATLVGKGCPESI